MTLPFSSLGGWRFEEQAGSPDELFEETSNRLRSWAQDGPKNRRLIRILRVDRPSIVLGSAQAVGDLRESIMRPVVVRRRSGGGAVWLEPDSVIWLDVMIERHDPLWLDDVGRAVWWLGEAISAGLFGAGLTSFTTYRGPMVRASGSRELCWLGTGAGEVVETENLSRKIVGIAQKRTRDQALFQVGVLLKPCQFRLAPWFGLDVAAVAASESSGFGGVATASPASTIEYILRAIAGASAMPPAAAASAASAASASSPASL